MKKIFFCLAMAGLSGCATYNYAQNMKLVSFDDNVQKGHSVGNIRGEDCTWSVFGSPLGSAPTIDRAFINAKNQAGAVESAGFDNSGKGHANAVRYLNNVSTKTDGFNAAGIVAKNCIVVMGVGYR